MLQQPDERTGMVFLQAESEIAAINMVYGAAGTGKKVMTSSSSPGISLKQEGISYMAGAELPCLIVNVCGAVRDWEPFSLHRPIIFRQPKVEDMAITSLIVLAPASVQEMSDFVKLGFELAFKYRNPVMMLSDGIIGQMMEKVELSDQQATINGI